MIIRLALAVSLSLVALTLPSSSRAQSAERPLRIAAGGGVAIPLAGGDAHGQIEESISYAVLPVDTHPGLFVGLALGEAFGNGLTILEAQARIGFELQLWKADDLELLANAQLGVGAGLLMAQTGFNDSAVGAFDLGASAEIALAFADGLGAVWVRPVGVDFLIRDGDLNRYQVLAGARLAL